MTDNPHDADDVAVYEKQGFGNRIGFGKKPALLVIDFINGFNDPDAFGGGNIQDAIDNTAELLAVARHMDLPIVFTSHVYAEDGSEDGVFNLKSPGLAKLKRGTKEVEVVEELTPRPGERVLENIIRPDSAIPTSQAGWPSAGSIPRSSRVAPRQAASAPRSWMPCRTDSGRSCRGNAPVIGQKGRMKQISSTSIRNMVT
jgi:hypothetical protein